MFIKTKSKESDFSFTTHISNSLDRIEKEQVHQRKDLSVINALLKSLINDIGLQKQVDDYFEETSPQTDSETKHDSDDNR